MKPLINLFLFLFVELTLLPYVIGQNLSLEQIQEIDDIVKSDMETAKAPGAMILVSHKGQTLFQKAYGLRNAKTKESVNQNTLFLTASVTKTITTAALLTLCDRRDISVSTPVGELMDSLPEDISELTLHQILSQSSGILDQIPSRKKWKNDAFGYFTHYGNKLVCKEIQEVFSYTNFGHVLAGMILAKLNQSSFEEAVNQIILNPLSMNHTSYSVEEKQWENHTAAHKNGKVVEHNYTFPLMKASASMFSTAVDLSNFAQCFMNRGVFEGEQVIPERVIEQMISPNTFVGVLHNYFGYPNSYYGYGLMSFEFEGIQFQGHPGETTTQNLLFSMAPEQMTSFVIMSNAGLYPFINTFEKLTQLFLLDSPSNPEVEKIDLRLKPADYSGSYYIPEITGSKQNIYEIYVKRNELYIRLSEEESYELNPFGNDLFTYTSTDSKFPFEIRFYRDEQGKVKYLNHYWKTAIKKN